MNMPGNGAGAAPATKTANPTEGEKKSINPELWQACAGTFVNLPAVGTYVIYFPQGHIEQVAAYMEMGVNAVIPNFPSLPSQLICFLRNVTLHADPETDEVYAQMTLQPVPSFDRDEMLRSDLSMKTNKPQTEMLCQTLTASDLSTHIGLFIPRRAAEAIFPPLDFTMQSPGQELVARDLHDNVWTFRHVYRGQPKRHILTTGWTQFVSGKILLAGDSVLFSRDEKQQLLLGIRRANRQPANLSSSVLSSNSMHIGIVAAAAHAAANNSPFTVFYNPRANPSEFVIPLAKYYKAVCSNQISLGMRFRMMFETEESGPGRNMGTITGISDLDPVRWKNSKWQNLQVGWDESTAGERRRNQVSIWEIEPVTAKPRMPGLLRSGESFRHPWMNYLRLDIERGNFSKEEEETIIRLYKTHGNRWSVIAAYLPGRTDNEIKNAWNTYLKERLKNYLTISNTEGQSVTVSKGDSNGASSESEAVNFSFSTQSGCESRVCPQDSSSDSSSCWNYL